MSVLATAASLLLAAPASSAPIPALVSPNGRLEVRVRTAERLRFDVLLSGRPLLSDSTLSLRIDGTTLGLVPRVRTTRTERVDRVLEPPVRQKAKTLRERYNQLRIELEGGYAVAFRAFDEGVAYRFETTLREGRGPGRRRGGELPLRGRLERLLSRGGELLLPQRAALPPPCLEGAQAGRRSRALRRWWTPTA